ncbi:MAG: DUF4912 domain-containing protein [Planctomycetota bacterium]
MAKDPGGSKAAGARRTGRRAAAEAHKTRKPQSAGGAARAAAGGARRPLRRARRAAPPPPPVEPLPQAEILKTPASSKLAQTPASSPPAAPREPQGLPGFIDRGAPVPENYSLDRLIALVRDPQWLFSYWELHGPKLPELRAQRGAPFVDSCAWVLRIYRINEGSAVDMEIEPAVGNWYIHVGGPGKYMLELGLLSPEGEWISLLVSEIIETPREGVSEAADEEWRLPPEEEERLLHDALALADARKRGVSGFLGASRLQSSFALVSSMMLGASASGRPVAGSWGWSFLGASGRVAGSGSGSGGFGWLVAPSGAQEPVLERPQAQGGGPNWNAQRDLPAGRPGKTQQPQFKVKLPRVLRGLPLPKPTALPRQETGRVGRRNSKPAKATSRNGE